MPTNELFRRTVFDYDPPFLSAMRESMPYAFSFDQVDVSPAVQVDDSPSVQVDDAPVEYAPADTDPIRPCASRCMYCMHEQGAPIHNSRYGAVCYRCARACQFRFCAMCGDWAEQNGEHEVCRDCARQYQYYCCEECGRGAFVSPTRSARTTSRFQYLSARIVCGECYDSRTMQCELCSNLTLRQGDDTSHCATCVAWLAQTPHTWAVGTRNYARIGSRRHFGVELETSRCPQWESYRRLSNATFSAKTDGSIAGMEFVSPPMYGDGGLREVDRFCEYANDNGWAVNATCGYHLHVDVSDITPAQLARVCKAYRVFAPVWHSFVPESRRSNDYCTSLHWDHENVPNTLGEFFRWSRMQNRYQWVNVAAYPEHKTIEIRLHPGSLNAEKVCNWVMAHTRFVDYWAGANHEPMASTFDDLARIWELGPDGVDLTSFYRNRASLFRVTTREDDEDSGEDDDDGDGTHYDCDCDDCLSDREQDW